MRDYELGFISAILRCIEGKAAECHRPHSQRHGFGGLAAKLPQRSVLGETETSLLVCTSPFELLVSCPVQRTKIAY